MNFRLMTFLVFLFNGSLVYGSNPVVFSTSNSPTGKILYVGQDKSQGKSEIYIMNVDGSHQHQITHNAMPSTDGSSPEPAISPNGKLIAFSSNNQLYVINSDGTGQHKIADSGQAPAWSPDGKSIAFHSYQTGNWEIFVINVDGTNPRNITNNPRTDTYPSWSPDGKWIAFHTTRDGKDNTLNANWEIYKMNTDGSNPTRLTTNKALDWLPTWSPDGKIIAFWSKRDGQWEIYLMDNDGNNQRRLTYHIDTSNGIPRPAWSPDGKYITFTMATTNGSEVRAIDIKERNIIKIPSIHKITYDPQWFK